MTKDNIPKFLVLGKRKIEEKLHYIVDNEFKGLERRWKKYLSGILPELKTYLRRDGKRIRPILTLESYFGYGGESEDIMLPAIATELMHASFVANDDLYDDMPDKVSTRGGDKVLQDKYFEKFKNINPGDSNWDSKIFSNYAATVAINLYVALGGKMIQFSNFNLNIKQKAMDLYWQTVMDEWSGQGMDVLSKAKSINKVTEDEVRSIELSRSASYSTRFPLMLGAVMAGAPEKDLKYLSEYAFKVGYAFQIYDDILGMYADSKVTGKIQYELAEGKRTLLLQKTMELGSSDQKKWLMKLLKKHNQSIEDVEEARTIIKDSGAYNATVNIARIEIESALHILEKLSGTVKFKNNLRDFALFVNHREK